MIHLHTMEEWLSSEVVPPSILLKIDGLVTSYAKSTPVIPREKSRGIYYIGSSKGFVYVLDLDIIAKEHVSVPVQAGFKTNPVSQALHATYSFNPEILIVGGEMSDTIIYTVLSV
jgi:hypothetical protein